MSIHSPVKKYVTSAEVKEDKRKMLQRYVAYNCSKNICSFKLLMYFSCNRQEELEYLGFISGITQDILSRRFLSDAALELLIGCHIERNLHRLDKVCFSL